MEKRNFLRRSVVAPSPWLLPSLVLVLLLLLLAGALGPGPAPVSAKPEDPPAIRPFMPFTGPHRHAVLGNDSFDANCTVDPVLVLPPDAPCNYWSSPTRASDECYEDCLADSFCSFFLFISTPPLEDYFTCYLFTNDPSFSQCNVSDLVPPQPEWGTVVFGSWDGGNCTEDITAPVTFPFPGECLTDPAVALAPGAPCEIQAYTYKTVEQCLKACALDTDCYYITFYSNTPSGTPNCYLFRRHVCDASDLLPPNPDWGTMVYAWWNSRTCPDISYALGDPHFVGARGTRFDFNGNLGTSYCLVTDKKLHINALLAGYHTDSVVGASASAGGKGVRSWMRELGILWIDARGQQNALHLVARSGKSSTRGTGFLVAAELNGRLLDIRKTSGPILESGAVKFTFIGNRTTKVSEKEVFRLLIPARVDMTLELQPPSLPYRLPDEAFVHFNIILSRLETSSTIHGILGQTYQKASTQLLKAVKYSLLSTLLGEPIKADGASGYGFLDGTPRDYAASGVLKPNCAMSAFAS